MKVKTNKKGKIILTCINMEQTGSMHIFLLCERNFSIKAQCVALTGCTCANKSKTSTRQSHLPMFRVTVMMLRDMVESVMLLNDEDWEEKKYEKKI